MKPYDYKHLAKYYDLVEWQDDKVQTNKRLHKLLKKHGLKKKNKLLLDACCGTGVQSIYLHKQGYDVRSADLSPSMIKVAKNNYDNLILKKGDLRFTNYSRLFKVKGFNGIITMLNSIGHLSKNDFSKALSNLNKNLVRGGLYFFDILNLDYLKNNEPTHDLIEIAKEFTDEEGREFKCVKFSKNRINAKGIMDIYEKSYLQEGDKKIMVFKKNFSLQIYNTIGLKNILESNGFKVLKFLDFWTGKSLNPEEDNWILTIAKKS